MNERLRYIEGLATNNFDEPEYVWEYTLSLLLLLSLSLSLCLRGLPEEECFVDMEFLQSNDLHTITRMGDMKLIEIKQESRGKTSFENVPAAPREVRKDGRYPGPM